MSNLEKHAEDELRRAGLFDKDSDYGGMIGEAVMMMIRVFAEEGHSGFSAKMTCDVFDRLARFKTLTPITSSPDEWMEVGEDMRADKKVPVWQNRRQSSCFSNDGGKTYYDIYANDNNRELVKLIGDIKAQRNADTVPAAPCSPVRTEAERLVADIVNITGDDVVARRLAVAQTYLDTWNGRARRMLERDPQE